MVASHSAVGAMTIDVEEWFHAHNLRVSEDEWTLLPSRVELEVDRLLMLLAETRTTATFFVLGWVAERSASLVRRIRAAGHEIASHGYLHRSILSQSPADFRADIRRGKTLLEDIVGSPVRGYRAPSYSITSATSWALTEIREAGFSYDSSIYPVRAPHGRYGIAGAPQHPFEAVAGLWEYPLPVVNLLGRFLPAATGAYLRIWPMAVHRLAVRQYQRRKQPLVINVHPWELDVDQPRRAVSWRRRFLHYTRLSQTRDRLHDLLTRGRFTSIGQLEAWRGKSARRSAVEWGGRLSRPNVSREVMASTSP